MKITKRQLEKINGDVVHKPTPMQEFLVEFKEQRESQSEDTKIIIENLAHLSESTLQAIATIMANRPRKLFVNRDEDNLIKSVDVSYDNEL